MNKKCKSRLWLYFTLLVFVTVFAGSIVLMALWLLLFKLGVLSGSPFERRLPLALFGVISVTIGSVITMFVGRLLIRPVENISGAFDELSKGNFSVKVPENEKLREIREMAERFNAMTYDLSHIETLRSDFVVNVSHEFKTPLAAIEGYAALLQNPRLLEERRARYIEKILENSGKLSGLLSSVLMLSKLENQETVPDCKEYRLDEQLRRVILGLENKWSEKEIEFDMDLPCVMYRGSEQLLEQVWSNIIDNAVKHSPHGGIIRVNITNTENAVSVCIADNGEGMSEEITRHIFEKFYQGDSSRKAEGNGLGLALVKRIVDLCKGNILVKSAPGEGAEFTVVLLV